MRYESLAKTELEALLKELEAKYAEAKSKGLKLDMSRGKPAPEQLDLLMGMLHTAERNYIAEDGTDCRNYGGLTGIPEARRLVGELMGMPADEVIVSGNSSLTLMYDMVSRSVTHGVMGGPPWHTLGKVKFLCPVPGYDRHFGVTQHFGVEMLTVPMTPTGPDMDLVEKYVSEDEAIKGIWCVPKYSNPQGISYSDETVRRFAHLKPAAKDFRIYWDNAYIAHHLYDDEQDEILHLLTECEAAGNPDLVFEFASFSKISFTGAAISALAASKANLDYVLKSVFYQTIGPDKLNMLWHANYFKDLAGIKAHMRKHAEIVRPKFEAVLETLERELGDLGIGSWTKPKGGYFISFEALPNCAKAIVALCKEAGVTLTGAGAAFPYGHDPNDSNIRIAPTFPSQAELQQATDLFVLCVKLASARKLSE
jgi:DNA-binding transcriptional MocR family regulator